MTTLAAARDSIFTHFNTYWTSEVVTRGILTAAPYVVYQNVDFDPEKDVSGWPVPHVEIEVQHITGGIASLGGSSRLFRREGLVLVQIKTLKGNKDTQGGTVLNDDLTQVVMDAFDGVRLTGTLWFKDVFPVELGPDDGGQFFITAVTAEFQYDDIK